MILKRFKTTSSAFATNNEQNWLVADDQCAWLRALRATLSFATTSVSNISNTAVRQYPVTVHPVVEMITAASASRACPTSSFTRWT